MSSSTETMNSTDAGSTDASTSGAAAAAARNPVEDARPLLLQALALIVATTLVFWLVGLFRTGDGAPVVAGDAGTVQDDTTDDAAAVEEGGTNGIGAGDVEGEGDVVAEPDAAADEAADEPEASTGEEPAAEADDAPVATPEGGVAPATVSVQVLDAVLDDGGAAANAVADRLRSSGYNVVVVNKASVVYDQTTVFFSQQAGQPAADQVAEAFGFERVGPKPDNLSGSVTLHVVVGNDAG